MNAVSMPQVRWRSTWQCMNHTPEIEKIYNITPNLNCNIKKNYFLGMQVSSFKGFYFLFLIDDMSAWNIPGLDASNLIATQPFEGTEMVF